MSPFDTSPQGLQELIRQGENTQVEFKSTPFPEGVIASVLTAFANSEGGILLIGVEDNGAIKGLRPWEVPDVLRQLQRVYEAVLFTPADVNATKIDANWVAYAIVSPAPPEFRPVRTSDGTPYQRSGTSVIRVEEAVQPKPPRDSRQVRIFIAMSFREEEEPALVDYFTAMERAAKSTKLPINLFRIDHSDGDYEISQQIMNEILASDAVIADFTLSPRNVYFELGFARGARKRVLQTARKGTSLEFDVRNWKTLFYKNATELERALASELTTLYHDVVQGDS